MSKMRIAVVGNGRMGRMIDAVLDGLTPDETDSLVKALAKLDRWFRGAKA